MSILRSVILVALGLMVAACVRDINLPEPEIPTSSEVNIRFRMSMPSAGLVLTRTSDDGEFAVNNISLLVFAQENGSGDFIYRYTAVGRKLSQTGNTAVDFEALLTDSDDPVRLLAIANCPDGLLDAIQGTTEAEVRSELVSNSSDFSQGLPMSGVAQLASVSDETGAGIVRIPLVRSVAKATVAVLLDGSSPDFTVTSVEVWHNSVNWQFFPDAQNIENETTAPVPIIPSVPSAGGVVNRVLQKEDNSPLYSGYVYETAIPSGLEPGDDPAAIASCIVVGGLFDGAQTESYYRINFGKLGDRANPLGQVMRNYWYEFTIAGVDGPGWDSAATAAANPAAGLRISATPWNGGGNTDYYFGHNDYIKLSADSMVLAAQQDRTATMTITTSSVPFIITSVHNPGAGMLDTSASEPEFETDNMRFEMTPLPTAEPGEQKWQVTATALNTESIVDYLQLHAADGLLTISIFIQRDPPPGHILPGQDDPTKRKIRVLQLGPNTYGSLNRQTNRAVPAMLRNTGYFGPTGTVLCAGVEILPNVTTVNDTEAVRGALAGADIIVTAYDYYPSNEICSAIWEWITAPNSGRVAFLTSDNTTIIKPLRDLLDGQMIWRYNPANLGSDSDYGYGTGYTGIDLAAADPSNSPFLHGIFGNAHNCGILRARPYDTTSQYINISNADPAIVPLMVATGSSGRNDNVMLMGIDTLRHIVYIGDALLLHTEGFGTGTDSSLAYDPANYINAMWSNTWAWAIERVMTENYYVEEAMVE